MEIGVCDAERHGSSVSAFVDFKVKTRTSLQQYTCASFFVRRRYRDFVWLRGRLCRAHPGAVVPPIPGVDSLVKDDRFSQEFIHRRQAGLQMFLARCSSHATLRTSVDLQTFLEAKVWELQTVKNASERSSWLPSLFSDDRPSPFSLVSATLGVSNRPPDEAIEDLRRYANRYVAEVETTRRPARTDAWSLTPPGTPWPSPPSTPSTR